MKNNQVGKRVSWFGTLARTAAGAALVLASSASVFAAPITFTTILAPEAVGATGSGTATVIADFAAGTLSVSTSFSGLSAVTTQAHIHCCTAVPFSGTASVAVTPGTLPDFPLGVTSGNYSRIIDANASASYTAGFVTASGGTVADAQARLLAGLYAGSAYLNIHTTAFPGGEIRGFLQPVPEPATLLLFGSAAAFGVVRRRRRQ